MQDIPWPLPSFEDFSDELLDMLRRESKKVVRHARLKRIEGHEERSWELQSTIEPDRTYRIYSRQLLAVESKFSCGLLLDLPGRRLTLCRYNGPSHSHTNALPPKERCPSEQPHRHWAKAQYLAAGLPGDRYAEPDTRYRTLDGALHHLTMDCAIIGVPTTPERKGLWNQLPMLDLDS